jgi:UDP-N-acetylmuramoyl-L-alanyl-D-glutamate--2,6-diaminopimelate ligase
LFDWPGLHGVVINVDDAAGQRYWQRVQQRPDIARLRCIAYSIAGAFGANLRAENIAPQAAGTRFEVVHGSERHQVTIGVIGDYNVANWLACLGALLALPPRAGAAPLSLSAAIDALRDVRAADGRVQLIGGQDAPLVVVDYAHTPDALDKILRALRPVAQARGGRLISVFGCGGDRDRGKRPQMAQLSAALADLSVLTSDNPRTEDPQAILADMRAGLPAEAPHWADADRRAAIQRAIGEAAVADVVLIAGKGHERTQEIAGVRHPFYDPDEARIALAQRNEAATC